MRVALKWQPRTRRCSGHKFRYRKIKTKMNVRNVGCGSLESVLSAPKVGVQWTVMLLYPSIPESQRICVTGQAPNLHADYKIDTHP